MSGSCGNQLVEAGPGRAFTSDCRHALSSRGVWDVAPPRSSLARNSPGFAAMARIACTVAGLTAMIVTLTKVLTDLSVIMQSGFDTPPLFRPFWGAVGGN